ncbi:MAG: hypothetical protein RLZ98_2483 [Pseudomonadota bacterium]
MSGLTRLHPPPVSVSLCIVSEPTEQTLAKSPRRPGKVVIHGKERLFDRFFAIDKLTTTHPLHRGGALKRDWLVFERGDAVAVLLHRTDTGEVVFVRQFRAPTLVYASRRGRLVAQNDGQIDETVAGMVGQGESAAACAVRETYEETGYRVTADRLELIATFYTSPGGSSERIILYYVAVTQSDLDPALAAGAGGVAGEGEDTLVRHVPVADFFSEVLQPQVSVVAKLLAAALLLRDRLERT